MNSILQFLYHQYINGGNKIEWYSLGKELSIEPVVQKVKLVVLDRYEFENWDLYVFKGFLTFWASQFSDAMKNIDHCSLKHSSSRDPDEIYEAFSYGEKWVLLFNKMKIEDFIYLGTFWEKTIWKIIIVHFSGRWTINFRTQSENFWQGCQNCMPRV